jgi:hypothetical protein
MVFTEQISTVLVIRAGLPRASLDLEHKVVANNPASKIAVFDYKFVDILVNSGLNKATLWDSRLERLDQLSVLVALENDFDVSFRVG